ncbi:hypothetical protein KD33_16800 [Clostridium sp. NCR]|nr:hypothetical protein KD33_16800 [Clostridium sp. NCR]
MVYKLYSKRIAESTNNNDPYEYDSIPDRIRMQVVYIIRDTWGRVNLWHRVVETLLREYGLETLVSDYCSTTKEEFETFLKTVENINYFLDAVELAFVIIDQDRKDYMNGYGSGDLDPDEAIETLNHRFKENNLGYEYCEGEIIRIDRKFTHKEIVKPALNLLYEEEFTSANEEFLLAHRYYKEGCSKEDSSADFKNAIINCNKAFESTMKIICENKSELVTRYNSKHAANDLINDLIEAKIIPKHLENNFHGIKNMLKGLISSLENGLPVIRNKVGHGQGTEEEWISEEFVTYAINLTATNIVLLINLYKKL